MAAGSSACSSIGLRTAGLNGPTGRPDAAGAGATGAGGAAAGAAGAAVDAGTAAAADGAREAAPARSPRECAATRSPRKCSIDQIGLFLLVNLVRPGRRARRRATTDVRQRVRIRQHRPHLIPDEVPRPHVGGLFLDPVHLLRRRVLREDPGQLLARKRVELLDANERRGVDLTLGT